MYFISTSVGIIVTNDCSIIRNIVTTPFDIGRLSDFRFFHTIIIISISVWTEADNRNRCNLNDDRNE